MIVTSAKGLNSNLILVLIIFHSLTFIAPNNNTEDFVLNPWTRFHKIVPKIIKFDRNGDFSEKNVNLEKVINVKRLVTALAKKFESRSIRFDKLFWNTSSVIEELRGYVEESYAMLKPRTKLRILTHCNKPRSVCRFLACPNIRKQCKICEVNMKRTDKNATICETVSTRFLVTQR